MDVSRDFRPPPSYNKLFMKENFFLAFYLSFQAIIVPRKPALCDKAFKNLLKQNFCRPEGFISNSESFAECRSFPGERIHRTSLKRCRTFAGNYARALWWYNKILLLNTDAPLQVAFMLLLQPQNDASTRENRFSNIVTALDRFIARLEGTWECKWVGVEVGIIFAKSWIYFWWLQAGTTGGDFSPLPLSSW